MFLLEILCSGETGFWGFYDKISTQQATILDKFLLLLVAHSIVHSWDDFTHRWIFLYLYREIKPWRLHFPFVISQHKPSAAKQSSSIQNSPKNCALLLLARRSLSDVWEIWMSDLHQDGSSDMINMCYKLTPSKLRNYHKIYASSFFLSSSFFERLKQSSDIVLWFDYFVKLCSFVPRFEFLLLMFCFKLMCQETLIKMKNQISGIWGLLNWHFVTLQDNSKKILRKKVNDWICWTSSGSSSCEPDYLVLLFMFSLYKTLGTNQVAAHRHTTKFVVYGIVASEKTRKQEEVDVQLSMSHTYVCTTYCRWIFSHPESQHPLCMNHKDKRKQFSRSLRDSRIHSILNLFLSLFLPHHTTHGSGATHVYKLDTTRRSSSFIDQVVACACCLKSFAEPKGLLEKYQNAFVCKRKSEKKEKNKSEFNLELFLDYICIPNCVCFICISTWIWPARRKFIRRWIWWRLSR